jgi:hypothetical protein
VGVVETMWELQQLSCNSFFVKTMLQNSIVVAVVQPEFQHSRVVVVVELELQHSRFAVAIKPKLQHSIAAVVMLHHSRVATTVEP